MNVVHSMAETATLPEATASATPYEMLCELHEPSAVPDVHLCERVGASTDWTGFRLHARFPDPTQLALAKDKDVYFCIGGLSRHSGVRGNGFVVRDYLIVLDDVGVKSKREDVENLEAFGFVPVMVVETSPGSFQYFYRLDRPVDRFLDLDAERLAALELVRARLADPTAPIVYGDTAVHDPARYLRLPFGINSKPKRIRADGTFPQVRLDQFNRGARTRLEDWASFLLGDDWQQQAAAHTLGRKPSSANAGRLGGDRGASIDDVYVRLAARVGLDPHYARPGVVNAICPNAHEHTNGDPTGFAFINPYRGHCQHEHCKHFSAAEMMAMVEKRYEDEIAANVAAAKLVKDGEGRIRDKAGQAVPATGRTWMAHDEFANRMPLTIEEVASATEAALRYQMNREERSEAVRALDDRYCLVPTMDGVVDLKPLDTESVHYNVLSKTHFGTITNRDKITGPNGKMIGVGAAWLDDPKSPLYEAIGCWPVGEEPPRTLNLWQGIKGAGDPLPSSASCARVLNYLDEVVASRRPDVMAYLLDWMAWKIQNPLKKHGVNLVLIGDQGTGKSTLGELIISILGRKFAMAIANEQHLLGNFNAHLEGKLFLLVDEALFGKNPAIAGRYKALTTETTTVIERKGIDAHTVPNMMSMLICSNSLAGVPVEPGDRRATVIEVANLRRNDTAFFKALWAEWASGGREAFIHLLLDRDVTAFEPRLCLPTPEKAELRKRPRITQRATG